MAAHKPITKKVWLSNTKGNSNSNKIASHDAVQRNTLGQFAQARKASLEGKAEKRNISSRACPLHHSGFITLKTPEIKYESITCKAKYPKTYSCHFSEGMK